MSRITSLQKFVNVALLSGDLEVEREYFDCKQRSGFFVPAVLYTVKNPLGDRRTPVYVLFNNVTGHYIAGSTVSQSLTGAGIRRRASLTPSQPLGWEGESLTKVLEQIERWKNAKRSIAAAEARQAAKAAEDQAIAQVGNDLFDAMMERASTSAIEGRFSRREWAAMSAALRSAAADGLSEHQGVDFASLAGNIDRMVAGWATV